MIISKNKLVGFPKIKPNVAEDYHGWFGPKNEEMLLQDVRKSKVIVELGSWLGKSTIWICKNSNAIVFAVDHWEGSKEHTSEELLLKISSLQETFFVNCWNFRSRIIPIKMKTIEGIDFLKRENVIPDLIYLDSSHEYIDVLADLEKCYSSFGKVSMIGDDCNWKTVQDAVLYFCNKYKFKVINNGRAYKIVY